MPGCFTVCLYLPCFDIHHQNDNYQQGNCEQTGYNNDCRGVVVIPGLKDNCTCKTALRDQILEHLGGTGYSNTREGHQLLLESTKDTSFHLWLPMQTVW